MQISCILASLTSYLTFKGKPVSTESDDDQQSVEPLHTILSRAEEEAYREKTIGDIHFSKQEYSEAYLHYARAAKYIKCDFVLYYRMAFISFVLQMNHKAKSFLVQSMECNPEYDESHKLMKMIDRHIAVRKHRVNKWGSSS